MTGALEILFRFLKLISEFQFLGSVINVIFQKENRVNEEVNGIKNFFCGRLQFKITLDLRLKTMSVAIWI